ncbi:hypothetical protein J5J86_09025 [Aquabacter sp. L1I39]|uniref:hypothetical protein n=1 Tax=Aquabacter sp. L1I39 TaxID=2820278 RepID=UPI001ADAED3F|nr:hypothetical protein [Aquabacter sp. L1I39]QTL05404.1 hypothetical protein J5J86_09025 [Aquabacter sp. L1I39]
MEDVKERREERAFHSPDGMGPQGEPVKPAPKAKQGVGSGRIMTVLVVGIIVVVAGFVASYLLAV